MIGFRTWSVSNIGRMPESAVLTYSLDTARPSTVACLTGIDTQDTWPLFFAFTGVEACSLISVTSPENIAYN